MSKTDPDGTIREDQINCSFYDVRFGNLCNLKCRMCGPTDSDQWYDDYVTIYNRTEYKELTPSAYSKEKKRIQVELLKLQEYIIKKEGRVAIVLEGRDTAGKSSAYKFFTQYLIPKNFKYVNLGIPTKWESAHWFQRWKKVIPKKGEIAFLDRSWYTRALTEPVMGYCSEKQYRDFMNQVLSCLLYTSPSPRDRQKSRMPSSA